MKKTLKHHKSKHNDKHRKPTKKPREVQEQPDPCCINQEAIEKKNIWLMKELQKHPLYELEGGKWRIVIPKQFKRKYSRHMGHFIDYFNRLKFGQ